MIVIIFHNRIKSNQVFFYSTQFNYDRTMKWVFTFQNEISWCYGNLIKNIAVNWPQNTHTHIYRINDRKNLQLFKYLTLYCDSDLFFGVKLNISCNGKQSSGRTRAVEIYVVVCVCMYKSLKKGRLDEEE